MKTKLWQTLNLTNLGEQAALHFERPLEKSKEKPLQNWTMALWLPACSKGKGWLRFNSYPKQPSQASCKLKSVQPGQVGSCSSVLVLVFMSGCPTVKLIVMRSRIVIIALLFIYTSSNGAAIDTMLFVLFSAPVCSGWTRVSLSSGQHGSGPAVYFEKCI